LGNLDGRNRNRGKKIVNIDEFLKEIAPTIRWFPQTGWNYCHGCGKSMDSSEKLLHYRICSYSEDKITQKLRKKVIEENFPAEGFQQNKPIAEVPLSWYRNSIETTAKLSIDFKPTGSAIDETMYPSTKARGLSNNDLNDLKNLFSGKVKCRVKQVYTKDPIIDSIPMAAEYDQAWSERE
jgi:hypothetical protein